MSTELETEIETSNEDTQAEEAANDFIVRNWRNLVKPRKVEPSTGNTNRYGKFVIRPLERGYGITLGNSLRRTLLSSLCGAAITSVKIDGIRHEFSSVPGVVEDVTEIILNLKGVRISTEMQGPIKASLHAEGKAGEVIEVRASEIRFERDGTKIVFSANVPATWTSV